MCRSSRTVCIWVIPEWFVISTVSLVVVAEEERAADQGEPRCAPRDGQFLRNLVLEVRSIGEVQTSSVLSPSTTKRSSDFRYAVRLLTVVVRFNGTTSFAEAPCWMFFPSAGVLSWTVQRLAGLSKLERGFGSIGLAFVSGIPSNLP